MDNIERLYKCYEVLSEAGDKVSEVSAIKKRIKMNGTHIHTHKYTLSNTYVKHAPAIVKKRKQNNVIFANFIFAACCGI